MTRPQSEADLAEFIALAKAPQALRGGGTRGVPVAGAALDLSGLTGIDLYEPGALTIVAAAGTPVAQIETALAAENQRLAFEPMDHRGLLGSSGDPTIGGVVAANVSGPRRLQVGACRDFLLGVRYVDGMGVAIKNGGRVMKNVTGYDLVKLMAGSWGTLGALSQVSLKVLPMAETQATLRIRVADAAQAVRIMSAALGSPFEVTGAAYRPSDTAVLLRLEGFDASVNYRADRLKDLLGGQGEVLGTDDATSSATLWTGVRDVADFHDQTGDVWKLSVKPSDAPGIAARLGADGLLFDWGGGLIWARMGSGTDLRSKLGAFGGHATLVRADRETMARLGMFQPEPPALAAISAGLRARFDPRGIFNTGLMQSPQKA